MGINLEIICQDILEFYRDPKNIKGLEEYRKNRERDSPKTAKGGE